MPKKSIYLPDGIEALILPISETRGGYSNRLAGVISDWSAMLQDAMPEMAEKEWLLICDALNGVVLEGRRADHLGSDVADCAINDGLGEKWGVDGLALGRKIEALPLAGKIAITDVAYRFWVPRGIVDSYTEILQDCGARLATPCQP